ncbi:TetR/AcrR family transcriptional regulator C-terminal domain-containing protein [Frankia sp. AgB1.9]|uniref:TetR/AcrR family transcriptional regulator C-terminal domain-containing protein n=1 Tax=unclassified Frankia TaxID=2632575 RepID=UPI001931BF25|nr:MULTISPECIES: TetR/AcrR family transcriptional regulator C-terminal domain-containing protein [unclassified Frankia]MBL7487539.1 TetR/AcrR family transcriptional regulator C-terminal domain-containing protein [Frankia sp. AgW1.1]MBL7549510.1 TetR/AcrR family transcriptional regulator C-terminal domain-containing protein [Frankia sp. AgB1.9]MBL7620701.1 TetR/AcrR family transcriptional regulator C-terminal domain-containing protein [Frankia sp. AgB1.8]
MTTSSPAAGSGAKPGTAGRRGPGRPPRLSRELILEAAAEIEPEALTLQAVADRLNADRKAISYYVAGRDELLALVAERALVAELVRLVLPVGDWPEAIRVFARSLREALMRRSSLALYVTRLPGAGVLAPADQLLQAFLNAGFDADAAGRGLTLISAAVFEDARTALLADRFGEHPTQADVRRILGELPDEALPAIRRVYSESQSSGQDGLDFYLETIIAGLGRWLEQQPRG